MAPALPQFSHGQQGRSRHELLLQGSRWFLQAKLDHPQPICWNRDSFYGSVLECQQNIHCHGEMYSLTLVFELPSVPRDGLFH